MQVKQVTEKRAFLFLLTLLLIGGLYVLWPFIETILLSIILAILFYPLHERYLRWMGQRRRLAALASLLSVFLLLLLPFAVLTTLVTSQITGLMKFIPSSMPAGNVQEYLVGWFYRFDPWITKIEAFFNLNLDLFALLSQGLQKFAQHFAAFSSQFLSGTINFFFSFFIMMIVLFFLFRDGDKFFEILIRLSPVKDKYERALALDIRDTLQGVFYGSFLTALVQAVLATIGFALVGIPGYLVGGGITFFMAFIPIIGTGAAVLPLVIVLFIQGKISSAIFLIGYGALVIGSADNLLKPLLIRSNMHQLVLFLSLFGGMVVFGPLGLLLGPIIMALLTSMLKFYERDFSEISPPRA